MAKATNKAQAGTQAQATQGKADSKRKGKAEATADSKAGKPTSKPTADSKASKADKPAGRAEAEAAALAMVGDVKSHTGGRINLDSVRICPRKAGKVKAFLRPTYETPAGVTLTPYEAGGFTGFIICDLTTDAGRKTLAALISAKRKPTAAERKAAEAEASKGKADSKPASKGKAQGKTAGKPTGQQATQQAGKGKASTAQGKASKPTAGKGKAGQQAGKTDSKATA